MKISHMKKRGLLLIIAAILLVSGVTVVMAQRHKGSGLTRNASDDSSGFVMLTDVVPDAILEIRYFGTYYFVGKRIDGYMEPTALMTRQAADSLKAVSDDVMRLGYRL